MTSDPSLHSPPDDLYSIRFPATRVPHLTVTRFDGREAMNELASFDVTVYAQDVEEAALLPLLLGAQVVLAIAVPTAPGVSPELPSRTIAGIVVDVALLGRTEGARHGLRLRIAPRAWLLQKRTGTRIFQDKTAAEIATLVLGEHRVPHRVQLIGKYPVREYCVQYQETDWDFVTRLFAEEAYFFWFEQPEEGADKETLVVADSPRTYGALPGGAELRFRYDTGGSMILEEDMVTDFRSRAGLETTVLTLRDYDFERPGLDLTTDRVALEAPLPPLGGVALEHYEHHGEYEESDVDADNVRAGIEQLRARVRTAEGQSACRRLAPGLTFQLIDHDVSALDGAYVVTAVVHQGVAPGVSAAGAPPYRNRFEAAPAEIGFCLPKPARRVRQVLESAVVVGPPGQDIYCDRFGRVNVQFHWDRDGKKDQGSSCFLRVAQAWSGSDFGHQFIPRIGMEVLVSFLGGDPDRPVVIGCVPNAINPPQYGLPSSATRSGIRTRTSPSGGGSNEISFEDRAGAEQLYVHAQRDLDEEVGLDRTVKIARSDATTVGADARTKVGGHRYDETQGDHRTSIAGARTAEIGSLDRLTITGSQLREIGGSERTNIAGSSTTAIGAGRKLHVTGDDEARVDGARLDIVSGAETKAVFGAARATYSDTCSVNVAKGISLSVGSRREPATAEGRLSGELVLRGAGAMEIASEKKIRLRVGKTVVTLGPDEVRIEAEKISLHGKTIEALGEKGALSVGKEIVLKGDAVRLASKDKAILELDKEAKLDGEAVKIKPGLSADVAKQEEREEQSKDLEKNKIQLFDRAGEPIANAPYEVSFFGYFDEGESLDGRIEIPAFPDVEKALVRWGRPKDMREDPSDTEPYEYEMEVYLQTDAPDKDEALRRKLHNLGHQGSDLAAAVRHYQSSAGQSASGFGEDVQEDVNSRHQAARPAPLTVENAPSVATSSPGGGRARGSK